MLINQTCQPLMNSYPNHQQCVLIRVSITNTSYVNKWGTISLLLLFQNWISRTDIIYGYSIRSVINCLSGSRLYCFQLISDQSTICNWQSLVNVGIRYHQHAFNVPVQLIYYSNANQDHMTQMSTLPIITWNSVMGDIRNIWGN